MSVILVVEPDPGFAERIVDALGGGDRTVRVVADREAALESATADPPGLVLVDSGLPDAVELLSAFAARRGGPGSMALVPIHLAAQAVAADYRADAVIAKPFSDDELRATVGAWLEHGMASLDAPPAPPSPAPPAPPAPSATRMAPQNVGRQLSSNDIFGDILAEVEADVGRAVAASTPAPTRSARAARQRADDDELERKLEQTLSGVLRESAEKRPRRPAANPRPAADSAPASDPPPRPRRRPASSEAEIDQLLDQTLGALAMPRRSGRPRGERPAAQRPAAQPPAAQPLAEAAPPSTEPEPVPQPAAPTLSPFPEPVPTPAAEAATPPPSVTPLPATPADAGEAGPPPGPTPPPAAPAPPAFAPPPPLDEEPSRPQPNLELFTTQQLPTFPAAEGETFGEYTLLERIAVGGMAEVWKARRRGVEGFQKTVAIKRILSHLTDSPDFVTMFIDEAKLAAQLNHNNIIQIYDLGKVGDDFFIAMEFVDGIDLRSILTTARKHDMPLPVGQALSIAARVARALDYAHRKRGFDNRELGLVHRDVSPQNVLISHEGEIKLCDFGIAKAVAKASTTQMGALKGKLQYMSPEQAWGKPVDARSDIFSLGSVLFEMLTGEKLFTADSEIGVLDAVRDCRVRSPRALRPEIGEDVERIVHKALTKMRDDRYQTAGQMEQDIDAVLDTLKPTPSQTELAGYMERLHAVRFIPAAEAEPAPAAAASATPSSFAPTPSSSVLVPAAHGPAAAAADGTGTGIGTGTGTGTGAGSATDSAYQAVADPERKAGGRGRLWLAAILALVVLSGVAWLLLRDRRAADQVAPATTTTAAPADAATPTPPPDAGGVPAAATAPATGLDPAGDGAQPAGDVPSAADTVADDTAADDGAAVTDPEAIDLEELVNAEMERRVEKLRQDFERERLRIEAELTKAREAAQPSEEEPPPDAEAGQESGDEGGGGGRGSG